MKLKKGIPVIDQGDRLGFWGGKFGGNFVPETLKNLQKIQKYNLIN